MDFHLFCGHTKKNRFGISSLNKKAVKFISRLFSLSVPRGNRTPVVGSKILSPRPLDDGDSFGEWCWRICEVDGLPSEHQSNYCSHSPQRTINHSLTRESDGIRTRGHQGHNLVLYPAELHPPFCVAKYKLFFDEMQEKNRQISMESALIS